MTYDDVCTVFRQFEFNPAGFPPCCGLFGQVRLHAGAAKRPVRDHLVAETPSDCGEKAIQPSTNPNTGSEA